MAEFNGKEGQWITYHGRHLFIEDGKSVDEVVKSFKSKSGEDDVDRKNRQIKSNEDTAKKLNEEKDQKKDEVAAKPKQEKLEDRLSGDNLLDAQDMIEELRANGAQINDSGYVTLYHRTNDGSALQIMNTGIMRAKEDGVFFSTSENGQAEGFGKNVLVFKVPVEKLVIDDEFGDEAHVRIPLKNRNASLDVSKYIVRK